MDKSVFENVFSNPIIHLMKDGETLGVSYDTYKNLLETAKVLEREYHNLRAQVIMTPIDTGGLM